MGSGGWRACVLPMWRVRVVMEGSVGEGDSSVWRVREVVGYLDRSDADSGLLMVAVVGVRHMGQRASIELGARAVGVSSRLTIVICEVTETSAQCVMPIEHQSYWVGGLLPWQRLKARAVHDSQSV